MHLKAIEKAIRKGCGHDGSVGLSHWCVDCMRQMKRANGGLSQKIKRMTVALNKVAEQRRFGQKTRRSDHRERSI